MSPKRRAKALIPYLRKSSNEDEALSFDRQLRACQAWAGQRGVELTEPVREPHVSGDKDWQKRALGEAIAAVQRGEAAGIICDEQNRLSRGNLQQQAEIWSALEVAKARLVVTSTGLDTANQSSDDEFNFGLQAVIARKQWREFKRRSDAVKENRIAAGVFIGPAPTGYTKRKGEGLVLDPVMAPLVKHLFEMRASGSSWGDLLKYVEAETGRTWTQPGVAGIVRNPVYRGDLVYGDLVNEGAHEAIVDTPLWHAAQRRGKTHARSGPKTDRWLLSGRLQCGSCGSSLIVWKGVGRRRIKTKANPEGVWREQTPDRRYKCKNRKCPNPISVHAPRIEDWSLHTLWQLLGAKVSERTDPPDLAPLHQAAEVAQRRFDQVMAPEARDALGEHWAPDAKARRVELEEAQAALGEAQAQAPAAGVEVTDLRDRWEELTGAERREALDLYGARVRVYGKTPETWELVFP